MSTRVNCVDINSREVIEQYLIEVAAEKPVISQVKRVQSKVGQDNFYKMPFKNPETQFEMVFNVTSSNSDVVVPRLDRLHFKPRETK